MCDVSDLAAVRAFAVELSGRLTSLDVLVHNAGLLPAERSETVQGHEITLATHVLGPMLLTELLVPLLGESADPRVILMSSGGMYTQPLAVADPEYRNGRYRGAIAYARTKRMQVAFTPMLARRWPGIRVYSMHPGWADTPGSGHVAARFSNAERTVAAHRRRGRRHRGVARCDQARAADRPVLARPPVPPAALSTVDPAQ